jgi:hypothetical protein
VGGEDHGHQSPVGEIAGLSPVERLDRERLDQHAQVPGRQLRLSHVPKDQREQEQVGEQGQGQQPLAPTGTEVEQPKQGIEQVGGHRQQPDDDGHRSPDEQVEPGDAAASVAQDGGRQETRSEDGAEDPEDEQVR